MRQSESDKCLFSIVSKSSIPGKGNHIFYSLPSWKILMVQFITENYFAVIIFWKIEVSGKKHLFCVTLGNILHLMPFTIILLGNGLPTLCEVYSASKLLNRT